MSSEEKEAEPVADADAGAQAAPIAKSKGKPQPPLTGRQARHLRALGHHVEPVVQIGKQGLTDSVTTAVDNALERHELVKVRVGTECPDDRKDLAARLAPPTRSAVAQVLGRTILLYRRHPKTPKIVLPTGK
jgi:RNA-binding protein